MKSTKPNDAPMSYDELRELLSYDPETGMFHWLQQRKGRRSSGVAGGSTGNDGYVTIKIGSRYYLVHRLAWFYMTKQWPSEDIDHINRNPADNRWDNLRICSRSLNSANANMRESNTSGFKGVTFDKARKRWSAQIGVNYRHMNLGRYATPQEAARAYDDAATKYFGEFAVLNFPQNGELKA